MTNQEVMDRWQRLEALFHAAAELPAAAREPFLARFCPDDPGLVTEVLDLLAEPVEEGHLERVVAGGLELAAAGGEELPRQIGPYRVLGEIGRGGLATVYAAVREQPFHQDVAIKLVRRGLDTEEIVARMAQERQILASLDHPHIARLYDGGSTPDGRPYFVLERIDGQPIDLFCAERNLSIKARLELFLPVCAALQYAHQRLVVHRDLKPSNLLVTTDGAPKLLDFGIAKLLDPDHFPGTRAALATRAETRWLTPAYASPEQILGLAPSTASDVYSLGVLLYQLLTGVLPHTPSSGSLAALEREVLEREPAPASRGVPALAGDLDAILAKALRKAPEARYSSVEALAEDLRRHLAGLPVTARQGTFRYRASRFVRRHRLALAAASLALGGLVLGVIFALWQAHQAALARDRAEAALAESERQRATAEQVGHFLVDLFEVSEPGQARGNTVTAREILGRGAQDVRRELAREPAVQGAMLDTLGQVYLKLGLYPEAEPLLLDAVQVRQGALGAADPATAHSQAQLGLLRIQQGAYEDADRALGAALDTLRRRFGFRHPEVATVLNHRGVLRFYQDRYPQAEGLLRQALELRRELLGPGHPDTVETLNNLAAVWLRMRRLDIAEAALREALARHREAHGEDHPAVATNLNNLGALLAETERPEEARPLLEQALATRRKILDPNHPKLAETLANLGRVETQLGSFDPARVHLDEALERTRAALGASHPSVAVLHGHLGELEVSARRLAAAESHFLAVLELRGAIFGAKHPRLAYPLVRLGTVALDRLRPAAAEPWLRRALALQRAHWPAGSWQVAEAEALLGETLWRLGQVGEASSLLCRSVPALRATFGPDAPPTRRAEGVLNTLLKAAAGPGNRPPEC